MLTIKRYVRQEGAEPLEGWDGQHYVACSYPKGKGYTVEGVVGDIIRYAIHPVGAVRKSPKTGKIEYLVQFPTIDGTEEAPVFRTFEKLEQRVTHMLSEIAPQEKNEV